MSLQIRAKAALERRRRANNGISRFAKYIDDPVGFGREELGEFYTDDVIEIMESVRDNPVTKARSANAVGKTHAAARIAVWFYKIFEEAQIYTTAAPPEGNLKKLLWGEIDGIIRKHPALFAGDIITAMNIQRGPQSFITGVLIPMSGTPEQREAKFSGKHAPFLLFIVDEGDAVPDEIFKAIESSMSGGMARLLILLNPRAKRGETYRMERERRANVVEISAFRHPNVVTGQDIIPGAVSREKTVQRINLWSRPLARDETPDHECFEVPDFLEGATAKSPDGQSIYPPLLPGYRKITNPALSYMVLGLYPAQSEYQLINEIWIEAARRRWDAYVAEFGETPPAGVQAVQGQDVAEFGTDSNVACFRYDAWVAPFIIWSGIDTDLTATKAAEYYHLRQAKKANVDGTGVGANIAPKMRRSGCNAHSIKVASSPTITVEEGEFSILRDQLWWFIREWLRKEEEQAMLPPDDFLSEELLTPTYRIYKGKIQVMNKDEMKDALKRSPDRGDSLGLTFAPRPKIIPGILAHGSTKGWNPIT